MTPIEQAQAALDEAAKAMAAAVREAFPVGTHVRIAGMGSAIHIVGGYPNLDIYGCSNVRLKRKPNGHWIQCEHYKVLRTVEPKEKP